MSATNKRNGAAWELTVMHHFRELGFDCERLRLSGRLDEGDLILKAGGLAYVVECKATKTHNLTDFVKQAKTERDNYARARNLDPEDIGWVVAIKKRNASVRQAFMVTSLDEWVQQAIDGED